MRDLGGGDRTGSVRRAAIVEPDLGTLAQMSASPSADGYPVTLQPSEVSLLASAEAAGIRPAYSCRIGRCSTCKARVRSGETRLLHAEAGLSAEERAEGWILSCVRAAETVVEVDFAEVLPDVDLPVPRTVPCRIDSLAVVAPDVMRVTLRVPPKQHLQFLAGQHVEVIGPGGTRRAYSIAHAPRSSGEIELHIRRMEAGVMSSYWFEHAAVNDLLRIYGPLGTFVQRDATNRDVVFLATGTGIAPVAAHLEELAQLSRDQAPRTVSVYWGNRTEADMYWHPQATCTCTFVPVLSAANMAWSGARGHVQDVFLSLTPRFDEVMVYACGSDAMIHSSRSLLIGHGLDERRFHADAFVSSAEEDA